MKRHKIETELFKKGLKYICGLDEAGRGPIAGPVVAAAVILPKNIKLPYLNDSKLLTREKREELFVPITEKAMFGVGMVSPYEIDKIGILAATEKAFHLAILDLPQRPEYLLVDGRDPFFFDIPYLSIVKGDTNTRCIAAASIIAKVVRDRIMDEQAKIYPQFSFRKHKGYGTKKHMEEIKKYGHCDIHRKTFSPIGK